MIGENENKRGLGRRVFILYPVGTLVAAVVLVTAFSFYVLEVMRSAAYDENRNAVSVATVQVESWLGPYTNTMAGFRRSIEKQQLGDAAVRATLSSYFNRRPGVSEAFFGTSEGRFYTASGWAPHPNVAEPRTKDWYLEAARNFGLVSTGPAPSRKDGVPVITFSMPVGQKKERIRGVLGVDVQESAFEEQMAQAIQKKPGLFLIVDNSSDSLLGHVPRTDMGIEISRDSVYRRLQEIMPYRNAIPLSQGQGAYFLYDDPIEKDEWYVCVVRFPNYPFDAIYVARKSDVLSSVHSRMIDVVVVASMGILLLIGITTLVGRYLFSKTLGKALEESVRSSTLFESMLDSRYVSLVLTDSDFHVLHASSNIARLAGSTDWRSLRHSSLWDVIPNPEFRLFAERCREDESAAEQEKTLLLPVQDQQGDTLWWNFAFRTFVDSDVKVRYLILVSDETGNVRKSTILDAVMESAQSALVILDGDSRISYLSRTAVLHSGWSTEKLVGASLDSLELLGIPAATITELVSSENAGTGWSGNFSLQHHGLSKLWFRGEASVLQAHGRRIGYMIVLADITEVVNARQEAEQATRAKSDFLANMSHEIRTPMNAIIGMSHLVLASELPARQKDYVEKIDRAARSLLGIINDILDLSKIEARKVILENTAIDLPRQLSDVLNLAEIRIADKPIELLLDLDPTLSRNVLGDPLRLSQILTNLLGNASKFTQQGQILLSVRNVSPLPGDDLLVQFSVVDTGIGMNAEQIARLFVAFSQADGSITRKFGGTGLGLTISQSFVELMGGRIIVDSIPGVGSDFHFTIPMKAAPESVVPICDQLPPGDVLCLSSSTELRRIVRENLHYFGIPTFECEQADRCLSLLDEHPSVRWIIADAEWIASDLSDAISALRHNREKYNVILLTGNKIDDATCDWLAANGFAFQLRKPFNGLQLQDMLRTSLLDPAMVTREASSSPHNTNVYHFQSARILLVEDNQFNQQLVVDLLADTGLVVDLADHGEMGFEKVSDNHYDLVLMDVQMPILDGYGSTRKIRSLEDQAKAKIPILAMSAHALAGDAEKSISAGMDGHITKPIEPALLFQELARWLPCSVAGKNQGPNVADKVLTTDRLLSVLPPSLGFDPNVGIRRVGGQPGQYVRQLRRFCQDFRQTPALLRETVHRGEWLDATRIAHTFKGVSGTIGAERLSELAAYLEEQCRKTTIDQDLLDVFFVEHSGLLQYILTRLEKVPETETQPTERSHTGADALRQLARILAELEEPVAENAPSTCQTILLDAGKLELPDVIEGELKLLAEAIGSFNFDSASELRVQMSHRVQEALRVC